MPIGVLYLEVGFIPNLSKSVKLTNKFFMLLPGMVSVVASYKSFNCLLTDSLGFSSGFLRASVISFIYIQIFICDK